MKMLKTTLVLGLLLLVAAPAASGQDDVDVVPAYSPEKTDDVSPVTLPEITRTTLKNGVTLYVIPHHEVPVASVRLMVPAGSLFNPEGKAGLTSFMAEMMTKGTENRSSMELAGEIDFVGGSLSASSGKNGTAFYANVMAKDLELAMDLVSDVALRPTFPENEIERLRMQTVSNLMANRDDPAVIADEQFSRLIYGSHPYGAPESGTVGSVQGLTREDMVAQHERLFVPGHAVLIVAGDVKAKQAAKLAKSYFGDWNEGPVPEPDVEEPVRTDGGAVLIVDKDDAVQSQLRAGYVLAPYNMGDDFYAFQVMDYIFGGGGFSSRLMLKLRVDMGLTYGAYSGLEATTQPGGYAISSYTKTPSTGTMLDEIYVLMEKAIEEGFTEQELEDAKAYLTGSYPMRFETASQIASQFQEALLFDFGDPAEHIANYRQRIAAVTLDDVNEAARQYLMPEALRIAIVGKADEVKSQLGDYAKDVEVISVDEL